VSFTAERSMRRQRTWQARRTGVPMATGQQRWDRAYQLLLQWTATPPSLPAEMPVYCTRISGQ
jgi:hypothetical protein